MIGLLQELTLFYLYIAAVFLFAAASTGLLRFSEWRYRNSVANKLAFHSVNIGKGVNKKGEVIAIRIGVQLNSSALFPISFIGSDIMTEFDGHYPQKKGYDRKEFTIPPGGSSRFDDGFMKIPVKTHGTYGGKIQCTIKFGKRGALNNELKLEKLVYCCFNEKGWLSSHHFADL